MNDEILPWEQQTPSMQFLVNGQKVELFSPTFARVTIYHPFLIHIGQKPTEEQQTFVMNRVQGVVQYLLAEQIMDNSKAPIGIQTFAEYQPI